MKHWWAGALLVVAVSGAGCGGCGDQSAEKAPEKTVRVSPPGQMKALGLWNREAWRDAGADAENEGGGPP